MARRAEQIREDGAAKVAIVTGGGSGIGAALCRELARRGVRVVATDLHGPQAQRVADEVTATGGLAEACALDVSRESDVRRLVTETTARYGRLDYLLNNAGIAIGGDARDLTVEHWRKVLDVDLYGVLYGCLAAYPIMAADQAARVILDGVARNIAVIVFPANIRWTRRLYLVWPRPVEQALVRMARRARPSGRDRVTSRRVSCGAGPVSPPPRLRGRRRGRPPASGR